MPKKISVKSVALSLGLLWGVCLFLMTLLSHYTGYASVFLSIVADVYVGYKVTPMGSIVGLVYGFLDGFIGVYVFVWIYRFINKYFG